MQTFLLVCEGACNPTLLQVDMAVRKFQGTLREFGPEVASGVEAPRVAAAYQGIRHTEHYPIGPGPYTRCARCGTERRYGQGGFE